MEAWEEKLINNYGSAAVNKKIVLENEIGDIPRYVSEYILGVYSENGLTRDSIDEASSFIKGHKYSSRDVELLKQKLSNEFKAKVLDKFKVEIDLKNNINKAIMGSTKIPNMISNPVLAQEHKRLLIDGIWGLGELRYYPPGYDDFLDNGKGGEKEGSIELQKFKPLQLSNISFGDYVKGRKDFNLEEWLNILISTVGLNYHNYDTRKKLIIISRMIPMVEQSVFMMEFGKPGTGKTYCYENISAYSRVISGSAVSPAQLFYNLGNRTPGLILQYDVVLFDEIDKVKKKGIDEEVVNKLYKYLESFSFDRGGVEETSSCGIMMVGNMGSDINFNENRLLSELLHEKLKEEAFLTRLAGIVPGWELDPIKKRELSITKNYGFMADYFSEILTELRKENLKVAISNMIKLENAGIRDENSIYKIMSGMLKLLCPDGKFDVDVMTLVADFAVELRQKVVNQLYFITKKDDYIYDLKWKLK